VAVEINTIPGPACGITCIFTIIEDGGQLKHLGFKGGSGIFNTGF
jgi:hypothetical protein